MLRSSKSKLTRLQRELLEAFFARERRFFLTGGAALAGFHLHHRVTHDLDLFTKDAGATPATIAWVLNELELPDAAELPGDVSPKALRAYRDRLIRRLLRAAAP